MSGSPKGSKGSSGPAGCKPLLNRRRDCKPKGEQNRIWSRSWELKADGDRETDGSLGGFPFNVDFRSPTPRFVGPNSCRLYLSLALTAASATFKQSGQRAQEIPLTTQRGQGIVRLPQGVQRKQRTRRL